MRHGPALRQMAVLAVFAGVMPAGLVPAGAEPDPGSCLERGADAPLIAVKGPDALGRFFDREGQGYVVTDIHLPGDRQSGLESMQPFHAAPSGPPDRWGMRPAWIFAGPDGAGLLQAALLREGDALLQPDTGSDDCLEALRAAEWTARRSAKGLWQDPVPLYGANRPDSMAAAEGSYILAFGRLVSLGKTRSTRYLNFGRHWKTDFTVSWQVSLDPLVESHLQRSGVSLEALGGQLIEVRGIVEMRDGPHIELTHPAQLRVYQTQERPL
ncbi:hypothetical protein [Roseibium sp. RKSG952]|uniref:hypothetical protein n=1 Tax=Roseibium sp. RKSG952 TaxID=2529384 RepID=UPI0012BCEFAC|nr:hypothetical protein [Roseibium sp. RKSG952]MTH96921.1 hypothetical protein [Roseibium sp. RKSG952]